MSRYSTSFRLVEAVVNQAYDMRVSSKQTSGQHPSGVVLTQRRVMVRGFRV